MQANAYAHSCALLLLDISEFLSTIEVFGYWTFCYDNRHFKQAGDPVSNSVSASKHKLLLPNVSAELSKVEEMGYILFFPFFWTGNEAYRHSAVALAQLPPFTYFHYSLNLPNSFAYVYFLTWYNQSILCADSDKKQTV